MVDLIHTIINFPFEKGISSLTVQYINRRSKSYYLHEGKTKTGKPKYHFSMKKEGKLVKKNRFLDAGKS